MPILMKWTFIVNICLFCNVSGTPQIDFFEKKIRPILINECYQCHSEGQKIEGNLRLDWKGGWLNGGDSGQAIIPGQLGKSLFIQAIRHGNEELKMPPKKKLTAQQIEDLEKWVVMGAPDPRISEKKSAVQKKLNLKASRQYWAFQPIKDYSTPNVSNINWPNNSIDHFVLSELEKQKLSPSKKADKMTLLRRIHYDLTGLPPTAKEIDSFLSLEDSKIKAAIEEKIAELLQRKDFGIRWGRHWLDVARYADSTGGGRTLLMNEAWRYRDYVIDSFNSDKPYNDFIREQIAGDLMASSSNENKVERLISTGFLLLGPTNYELQDKTILEMDIIDEQLDTIGKTFMGLTLGCARCHDHKFDPISTEDYYGLAGIFKNTKSVIHSNVSTWNKRTLPLSKENEEKNKNILKLIGDLEKNIKDLESRLDKTFTSSKNLVGIVIDTPDAIIEGQWIKSTSVNGFINSDYLHDDAKQKGQKSITYPFTVPSSGRYEVRASYTNGTNREPKTPYLIKHDGGETKVLINQEMPPPIQGSFISLGHFNFTKDAASHVVISNENTKKVVIADSIQILSQEQLELSTPIIAKSEKKTSDIKKQISSLKSKIQNLQKQKPKKVEIIAAQDHKTSDDINIAIRGNVHNKGPKTPRQFIEVINYGERPNFDKKSSGRLELANWIASKDNSLTARVIVNRVWYHLFGEGIVTSLDNFGHMGTKPSNLKLLDHLSIRLIHNNWSIKSLIKEIMLSKTYQMDSVDDPSKSEIDPENIYLWRQNPSRLDAEAIRDTILFVGNNLAPSEGGPSIKPGTKTEYGYVFNSQKRSIFNPVFRNTLPEIMQVFDFADPNMVTGKRTTSSVPTQALYMLNSSFIKENATSASKTIMMSENISTSKIEEAYKIVLGRLPTAKENQIIEKYLSSEDDELKAWANIFQSLFSSIDFRFVN